MVIPINKWEKEVQKSLLDSEEATLAELQKQYDRALRDIGQKVKAFQVDIDMLDAALESDNLDDAARQRLLSQQRSKVYQKQFQEALQAQIEAILNNLQSQNYSTIEKYLKETYEDAYVGNEYILAQQGIPIITPIDQAAAVKAVLTDSKISTKANTTVGRLYAALGVDNLKKSISAEITRGIASSLSYADIARNLNNVSKAGYNNAKRIVVTEGHRIQQTAWHDSAVNAKEHGADLVRKWDAVLDGRTRPHHRQLDGQIREVDEPFEVGGLTAMFPGSFGRPGEDCNCRCIARSIPRILADGGSTKIDNFTKEVREFESPEDYADFKKKYWSKENIAYMKYVDALEKRYGTKDINKLLGMLTDGEYEHFKKLEDASPLWKAEYLRNNMPKGYKDTRNVGKPISSETLNDIIKLAEEKGVRIGTQGNPTGGFETYCGDVKVLTSVIEEVSKQMKSTLFKKSKASSIILEYDNVLGYQGDRSKVDVGAFAETKGKTIRLNKFMFDDSSFLAKEYAVAEEASYFPKGTDHRSVIPHEVGHIINRNTAGLQERILRAIEKEANRGGIDVGDYIKQNISIYASIPNSNAEYSELIPEINSLLNSGKNSSIIELLKKEGVIQ